MEASPLTQQERPRSFRPKIAHLYDELFEDENEDMLESSGFWREFFLLSPDTNRFRQRLEDLYPGDLLHFQHSTQQLFTHAVAGVKAGLGPTDENALDVRRISAPCSFRATYLSDFDSVLERDPVEKVHESKLRHYCCSCWLESS